MRDATERRSIERRGMCGVCLVSDEQQWLQINFPFQLLFAMGVVMVFFRISLCSFRRRP